MKLLSKFGGDGTEVDPLEDEVAEVTLPDSQEDSTSAMHVTST